MLASKDSKSGRYWGYLTSNALKYGPSNRVSREKCSESVEKRAWTKEGEGGATRIPGVRHAMA
jgi:hypothetical protein